MTALATLGSLNTDKRGQNRAALLALAALIDAFSTSIQTVTLGASGNSNLLGSTNVIGNVAKTSYNKLTGYTKFDDRPTGGTAGDYAVQVRSESAKTTGMHWGVDCETHLKATGGASLRSVQGVAVVDATFTATAVTLIGTYGQARVDGSLAGASFITGLYGLIEASSAMTASHVCSAWLDSHQINAVTGNHELLYMSNNGTASLDQVMYASGQANALIHLNTAGGPALNYVTDGDAGKKKIAILIEGVAFTLEATPVV